MARAMRRFMLEITALASCGLLIGCATRVPASALPPRLQYQGFSSARPPNDHWFINRHEQQPGLLLFRRDVVGASHSFFFAVQMRGLQREPRSNEDFADLVHQSMVEVTDPERHQVISYGAEPVTHQGQYCLRYTLETIDRRSPVAPGLELNMNFEGLACRHPRWPDVMLDAFYSERGVPQELDPTLAAEGEQLLRGITIEVAPGRDPAAVDDTMALRTWARAALNRGRMSDSDVRRWEVSYDRMVPAG
jgi:hypothetical protein